MDVEHVDFVSVLTQDLQRAKRFYTETLGLEVETEGDSDLELRCGQVTLDVFDPSSIGQPFAPSPGGLALRVPDVDAAPVSTQGPQIERHPRFPRRVNAGYLQIVDRRHARLRVYERGAGETLACGTGACAAMVAGRQRGLLDDKVEVKLTGGTLRVSWAGAGQPVWMTGPAITVFEGTIDLEKL